MYAGNLKVMQDPSKKSWYKVVSDTDASESGWYNKPVTLQLMQEDDRYDKISDNIKGPWNQTILVKEEGILDKDVYFRDSDTKAIAAPQEETVKVDEHSPEITSITEKPVNQSTFARALHLLSLRTLMKSGSEITIQAQDVVPSAGIEVSEVAGIDYKVYRKEPDEDGNTLMKEGSSDQATVVFTIHEEGEYKVCATAIDYAGNPSEEQC